MATSFFGGYPSFIDVPKLQRLSRWIRPLPKSARRSLAALATLRKSAAVRGKAIDMLGGPQDIASLTLHRRRLLSTAQMASLGLHAEALGLDPCFQLSTAIPSLADVANDPFVAISRMESVIYQGNVLLRDGDANGMAHGLEIRLPLLDQPVLNAIHALPGSIRMPAGARPKQLLCEAFPELLTPEIIHQRKMGFVFADSPLDADLHAGTIPAWSQRAQAVECAGCQRDRPDSQRVLGRTRIT